MAFSSASTLQQTDEVAAVASGSLGGGGGGVTTWDSLTGTLSGDVPFETVDSDGNPVSRGAAFSDDLDSGPTIRWDRDPAGGYAARVRDEANGQTLLTLDEDGNLVAAGDIAAFGSSPGSGGGGGSEFQAGRSLTLDTSTSPATLNANLVGGTNVDVSTDGNNDYVIDVPDAGAVDSVFGRTGAVTPQSGDYTHDQIGGISSDDHHTKYTDSEAVSAVNSETSLNVDITGDADTVDGYQGSDLAALSENETVEGRWNFKKKISPPEVYFGGAERIKSVSGGAVKIEARGNVTILPDVDDVFGAAFEVLGPNNNTRLHVSANGNGVGVENGSPSHALDVAGQVRGQDGLRVYAPNANGGSGGDFEIHPDGNGNLEILTPSGNSQTFFDSGDFTASGDVSAFGSGTGSGSGGAEFQAGRSLLLDGEESPPHLDVKLQGGTNVTLNEVSDSDAGTAYVIDVPDAGYTDADAVGAVNAETSLNVDITGDADTVDGYDGSDLAALSEDETVTGNWDFQNGIILNSGGTGRILWDTDKDGSRLYIQREFSSSETAMTIEGQKVLVGGAGSPSYTLNVDGVLKTSSELKVGSQGRLYEDGSGNTVLEADAGGESLTLQQGNVSPLFINATKRLGIRFDQGGYGNVFRIFGNGDQFVKHNTTDNTTEFFKNVGVQTNPSYALDVNGRAQATTVEATSTLLIPEK